MAEFLEISGRESLTINVDAIDYLEADPTRERGQGSIIHLRNGDRIRVQEKLEETLEVLGKTGKRPYQLTRAPEPEPTIH